jgi:hypothetical protein
VVTMTAREFNRDVSAAKREAAHGPVVITDRGQHVCMCPIHARNATH